MDSNREPDYVDEKIKENDSGGNPEDSAVCLWVEIVHANRYQQYPLSHDPLYCTKLDIAGVGREVEVEDSYLGKQEVGGRLTVVCNKGRPSSAGPPSDDEAEQTAKTSTSSLGSPAAEMLDSFALRRDESHTNRLSQQQEEPNKSQRGQRQ